VLQEDMSRAEHLLLAALDKGLFRTRRRLTFTLGVLRQMQIRLPEAHSEFETAISLDPNNARAHLHLAQTRLYLGEPEAGTSPLGNRRSGCARMILISPLPIGYWVPVSFAGPDRSSDRSVANGTSRQDSMVGAVFLFGRGLWSEGRSRQSAISPRRVTTLATGPAISRPDAPRIRGSAIRNIGRCRKRR
jgi:hypothetical protein